MVRSLRGFALLLAAGCVGCTNASADSKPKPSPAPYVPTVVAQQGTIRPTLTIAGVIAPYRQVGVAANLSEPITQVLVQEGDRVRAGQVLARLLTDDLEAQLASSERVVAEDVARYGQTTYQTNAVTAQDTAAVNSAQAALHQAEVNLAGAQTDLRRYLGLFAQGYLPEQTVDQQRTTVASDAAAVQSARAALNQAVANARANGSGYNAGEQQQQLAEAKSAADAAEASAEQLRRQIARATITAPVDGVIDAVNANPGEYPSGRQLFTEEQIDRVYAILPASTTQALDVRIGAAATIVAGTGRRRDGGTVTAVLDQIQPGTTNFTIKVLVPNADAHLRAGMPVTARVDEQPVSGVTVPVAAFVDDSRSSVYVVSNGVARSHTVSELQDDGKTAVVTGLPAGSVVVADVAAANVGNGDRVSVTSPPPNASPGPDSSSAP
ncbi:MAG TPA: efflux RND transporter periplasmic adaptor subunit [Candidatus Elarobacter sp.]|jgi:multidrug efflux pump subunit AcrA (membrane-fusion protein)|nr:efflux RND transporter periplasmic adaptor subunit [Candidatus Elarobacter sp.]